MQCIAVYCSVVQCLAVSCSVLQCAAVRCSVLRCVAVCCSVLQCVAVCCRHYSFKAGHWARSGERATPHLSFFFLDVTTNGLFESRVLNKKLIVGIPRMRGLPWWVTLSTPGNSLRFNNHLSGPPVSALAHSRGPRNESPLVSSMPGAG